MLIEGRADPRLVQWRAARKGHLAKCRELLAALELEAAHLARPVDVVGLHEGEGAARHKVHTLAAELLAGHCDLDRACPHPGAEVRNIEP